MSYIVIGDKGAEELAEALENNTTVKKIDLMSTGIGNKGVYALAKVLPKSAVREIDLSHNNIGNDGVEALANALKNNSAVTEVYLSHNQIGYEGANELIKVLQNSHDVTEVFWHEYSYHEEKLKVSQALKNDKTAVIIDLARNQISRSEMGKKWLNKALEQINTVPEIHLIHSYIGDEEIKTLVESLNNNSTVKKLKLGCNQIGNNGAKALADFLRNNKTVVKIDLLCNQIGYEGAKKLAEALQSNNTLQELELKHNQISNKLLQDINELLKKHELQAIEELQAEKYNLELKVADDYTEVPFLGDEDSSATLNM
ncbi:leucine-rich repeat domain-containing protein [Rickettsia endosymbiont of Culicoides newsteadi]|uniref:hypothetical protein n=1 Tax=Rickettsia endosymbiont of Culicoides newsteadi TaxID=1961830 RepID=UPI000B9A6B8B|nr:hypothetical protein [Rickettsia endosymbiont of Culicoides newsteadi]OZG31267.1 guanosine polyphosphate pyrophosphohydrolase [Rickettsia endosymbiont of Culicoides newsteadi]